MNERHDDIPTLKSLAVFAVMFFGILAFVSDAFTWLDPLRDAVAAMDAPLQAMLLAGFIILVLAMARVMVLISKRFEKGSNEWPG